MKPADADVEFNEPSDPGLRRLWGLALAKALGRPPSTLKEFNQVAEEYNRLATKLRGSLGQVADAIAREYCSDQRVEGG